MVNFTEKRILKRKLIFALRLRHIMEVLTPTIE